MTAPTDTPLTAPGSTASTAPAGAAGSGPGGLVVLLALLMAPVAVATLILVVVLGAGTMTGTRPPCDPLGAAGTAGAGPSAPVRVPVAGRYVVTSEFGMRVHPVTGQPRAHTGLDLATIPAGGPVVAAVAGTVVSARAQGSAGNTVTLDHGAGLSTRYLHLRSWSVTVGQVIVAGHQLGVEGTTGSSTGQHLHFEVRQDGQPLSPRTWLQASGVDVDARTAPAPTAPAPALGGAPDPSPVPPAGPVSTAIGGGSDQTLPVVEHLPDQVAGYRGDQLVNAATIIATGRDLGLDPWTITVAVMTAMGESSLRNLDRGDDAGPDSRGLFQQRGNGAWGPYTDRMNPATATGNFFTALLRVPGYRDLTPTIAAHRTQRNADPQHYARHWPAAVQLLAALTADPALVSRLADRSIPPECEPAPAAGAQGTDAEQILATAASLTGIPYRWGGSTPAAFDCSGYTRYVFAQVGVDIPRTAAQQQAAAQPVTTPQPGDLVFFGRPATHVGIYAGLSAQGHRQMYDAPRTGTVTGLHDVWSDGATYGRIVMTSATQNGDDDSPDLAAVGSGAYVPSWGDGAVTYSR